MGTDTQGRGDFPKGQEQKPRPRTPTLTAHEEVALRNKDKEPDIPIWGLERAELRPHKRFCPCPKPRNLPMVNLFGKGVFADVMKGLEMR